MPQNDSYWAFRNHSNYVAALQFAIHDYYAPNRNPLRNFDDVLEGLHAEVLKARAYQRLQRFREVDIPTIRKCLTNAWTTELMLCLGADLEPDDIIGIVNNWAVVQAYYSCFQATNAYAIARRSATPDNHETTQRVFVAHWITNNTELPPWSLAASEDGPKNFPEPVSDTLGSESCSPTNYWSLIYKAMRTTRQRTLDDRLEEARRHKPQAGKSRRLTREERAAVLGKKPLRDISLLDYLYRLRIRSNYLDSEMFVEGPQTLYQSRVFHQRLREITSATLLLHEVCLARVIGRVNFLTLADGWLKSSYSYRGGLSQRQAIYRSQ
jgi:hypothetical protein